MRLQAAQTLLLVLPLLATEAAGTRKTGVPLVRYAIGGAGLFDMDKVNGRLENLGLAELGSWATTVGVGEDLRVERLIVGHQFAVGLWPGQVVAGRQTRFASAYWLIQAGVEILPRAVRVLELYPLVGTGAGVVALTVNPQEQDFSRLLEAPATTEPILQVHYLLSVAAAFDYTLHLPGLPPALVVGARVGFVLQVTEYDEWWRNGTILDDGPKQRLNSLYLQGVVGLKRWMKWRRRRCGDQAWRIPDRE